MLQSKKTLNQIAKGDCPKCGGPLVDVDIETNYENCTVRFECSDCFTSYRATYDILNVEEDGE